MHDHAVDVGRTRVHDPAGRLGGDQVGEVAEGVGHTVDVDAPLLGGLARVPALQKPQLLPVPDQEAGDPAQERGPLGDGGTRPGPLVEGAARRRDREVGVPLVALRDQGERPGVRRVEDLPGAPETAARHSPPT